MLNNATCILVAVLSIPTFVFSDTIIVPDDHPTIQGAIDAAVNGDTVLVKPGTYVENIDFLGKSITVKSEQGSGVTVVDGNQSGSVVTFNNGEGPDSVLEGFMITNGSGTWHEWSTNAFDYCGAGIFCWLASPTITENDIFDNLAMRNGGGIYALDSNLVISGNLFRENKTYRRNGAGVYLKDYNVNSTPMITDNVFTKNVAAFSGGGVYARGSFDLTLTDNVFIENRAVVDTGGAIQCSCELTIISNNLITMNSADSSDGGGINCDLSIYGNMTLYGNTISYNYSGSNGGGVNFYGKYYTIEENTIVNNTTNGAGAGLCIDGGGAIKNNFGTRAAGEVKNNVITGNISLAGRGGGIYSSNWISLSTISKCILTGNSAVKGGGLYLLQSSTKPMIIRDNIICDNIATESAGGIYCNSTTYYDEIFLVVNTICQNSAGSFGGGIYSESSNHLVQTRVENSILWNNSAPQGKEIYDVSSSLEISYCDVEDSAYSTNPGCINQDPLFVNQIEGDYHLTFVSPCLGAGNNAGSYLTWKDFEGDPRIYQGEVDMGADEFYTHLYVTGDKTPGGSIQGKFIGLPGTTPVGLFIGSDVLLSPMNTMWGEFWLQAPWILLGPLGAIPADGVMVLSTSLPSGMTVPVDIPMQALIGLNADSLTNVCVLEVR